MSQRKAAKRVSTEAHAEAVTFPVIEEEIRIGTKITESGKVRVDKSVHRESLTVDTSAVSEEVEVKRVPVNRPIDTPAVIREEANTTIIPVMEEVVVVTKQLILKEEIHLVRRQNVAKSEEKIGLLKERVEISRVREK